MKRICGQLFVGWTNDLLDAAQDAAGGRTDKPLAAGQVPRERLRNATVVAAVLVVPLSLLAGLGAGVAHLVAVASATGYNLGLKQTPLSAVPYMLSFGLMPVFVTLGPPITHWPPLWSVAGAALLGAGAHFTQTLSDLERERLAGVRGLPQLLGTRTSAVVGASLIGAAAAFITLGPAHASLLLRACLPLALALLVGIVVATALNRLRLAFRLTLAAAAVVVGGVLVAGVAF